MRTRHKKISFLYQNVRGLRSKTLKLYDNVSAADCDFIVLTETFLTSSVANSELFPPQYKVLRKDRTGDVGWGGVLIAATDKYSITNVTDIDGLSDDKEVLIATVCHKNIKFIVCVVYLPPNYNDVQYLNVITCLENMVCKFSNLDIIVLGDFNLNSCSSNVKKEVDNFIEFCKFRQHNEIKNVYGGILDLVLTNVSTEHIGVSGDIDPLVPEDRYHPPLEVTYSVPRTKSVSSPTNTPYIGEQRRTVAPQWNFSKADFGSLYTSLAQADWTLRLWTYLLICSILS